MIADIARWSDLWLLALAFPLVWAVLWLVMDEVDLAFSGACCVIGAVAALHVLLVLTGAEWP